MHPMNWYNYVACFFAGIAALSTWLSVLFAKIKPANRLPKKMA
jgi:hypothetical protein